ncbi:MAG: hypothetical protein WAX85_01000 [Minisyncoccia bacterium]
MNEDKFKKGIEEIKNIGVNPHEKEVLFSKLMAIIQSGSPFMVKSPVKSPWAYSFSSVFYSHSKVFSYSVLAVLLFVGGGSGLITASNSSLPGELLYPIKVNVSEPLQGVATLDPISKADWSIEKIQRRFDEAEILAVQGRLDSTINTEIQKRIESETVAFGDADSPVLDSTIEVHNRILAKIEDHSDVLQKEEISKLRNSLDRKNKKVSLFTSTIAQSLSVESAGSAVSTTTLDKDEIEIEKIIKDTENNLNIQNQASTSSSDLEKDIISDTLSDLNRAKEDLKKAKEKKKSGNISDASSDLQNSRKTAENAKTFLKQGVKIGKEQSRSKSGKNKNTNFTKKSD